MMKYKYILLRSCFIFFCLFAGISTDVTAEAVYPISSYSFERGSKSVHSTSEIAVLRQKKLKQEASFGYLELFLIFLGLGLILFVTGLIIAVKAVWIIGLIIALFPFAAALIVVLVMIIWLSLYHGGLE